MNGIKNLQKKEERKNKFSLREAIDRIFQRVIFRKIP